MGVGCALLPDTLSSVFAFYQTAQGSAFFGAFPKPSRELFNATPFAQACVILLHGHPPWKEDTPCPAYPYKQGFFVPKTNRHYPTKETCPFLKKSSSPRRSPSNPRLVPFAHNPHASQNFFSPPKAKEVAYATSSALNNKLQ